MTTKFVYKWTHIPSLMWYVGSRFKEGCHPDDGYICSSSTVKPMIIANPEEWKREIVYIGPDAYDVETEILQLMDAKNDPRSFNGHNNTLKYFDKTGVRESAYTRRKKSSSHTGVKRPEHSKFMKENLNKDSGWYRSGEGSRPERQGKKHWNAKSYLVEFPDGSTETIFCLKDYVESKNWSLATAKDMMSKNYIPKRGPMSGIKITVCQE